MNKIQIFYENPRQQFLTHKFSQLSFLFINYAIVIYVYNARLMLTFYSKCLAISWLCQQFHTVQYLLLKDNISHVLILKP